MHLGGALVLDDVTLEVAPGTIAAVVGGDGAGKTTVARTLVGALVPRAGRVERPPARRIGYLPSSSGTYPDLTVAENIAFVAGAYGVSAKEAAQRTDEFLDRTGLAAARDRLAGRLSGGMRQKLGVVRAVVHRPDLVVLDEPTTGVDPVSRADLWCLVARAAADGAAVVVATCYLDEAERATSLVVLDQGRVLAAGSPTDIVARTPGAIRCGRARPAGDDAHRSWRRGGVWRTWSPAPPAGPGAGAGEPVHDLEDAVIATTLARQHVAASTTEELA
jgi:ABC-2 type transport system ATP-binding protein